MHTKNAIWKNVLLIIAILIGLIYAAPNLYGEDPAVQISAPSANALPSSLISSAKDTLTRAQIPYLSMQKENDSLLIRFNDTDQQLKARDVLKAGLNDQFIVALNLAPRTPKWLQYFGAKPMKLGLDLRGGVHFLLQVDVDSVVKARLEGEIHNFANELRDASVRYASIVYKAPNNIVVEFRNQSDLDKAYSLLSRRFTDFLVTQQKDGQFILNASLTEDAINKISDYAVEQNMTIFNNRVNELGVSEAIVQRQGRNHVSVDLPGVQDTARAKDIIGKTATLKFQMVDVDNDVRSAVQGNVPLGSHLYDYEDHPILLKNQVILSGSAITYATASFGEDGRPNVQIRLGGGGESLFHKVTSESIGKPLAVVYVETKTEQKIIGGKPVTVRKQIERVINVATIQSALGNNFQITGLANEKYAENLALLLRSGALTAPVDIVQERTVGPSLGAMNIHKGVLSLEVGTLLVIIFMILYYRLFGVFANLALILNVVFIVAILSILGATLTLPGIAGIVLTVGMAVDANVLINERIREELRNGVSPLTSIKAGYERAFSTIVDANVTTLIVAVVLFALGSGSVKGFAVTLTIGLLTSMVTAIYFTRVIVDMVYSGRRVKKLSIGI